MKKIPIPAKGLKGSDIIERLQRGHMVRRSCWMENFFIRICNESGYDEDGLAIFDDRNSMIYTIATNGYFMHLAFSGQLYPDSDHYSRDGEGIQMLWAKDWEDYGFISGKDFDTLTYVLKDKVRRAEREEPEDEVSEFIPPPKVPELVKVKQPGRKSLKGKKRKPIPESKPVLSFEPDFEKSNVTYGGKFEEIPEPHVYFWPASQTKRKVTVKIMRYYGYGPHYHVSMREEDNPIWDGRTDEYHEGGPTGWVTPWDSYPGKGRDDWSFEILRSTYKDRYLARAAIQNILDEHFHGYEIEWDDYTVSIEGEYYAGKHGE